MSGAQNTPEYAQLLLIRGHIASLTNPEDQTQVHAIAETIRGIVRANGLHGILAIALVGAEIAADEFQPDPAIIKEEQPGAPRE